MKITAITRGQKNKERYNIFIDGCYSFSVDEEVLARFVLLKDKELTEAEIEQISAADKTRKALNKAIYFLSNRIRSEKEIRQYLRKQSFTDDMIQSVLVKLTEMAYIDDKEFTIAYVRTQMRTTLKGPRMVERELIEKGITRELINQGLALYSVDKQYENAEKQALKVMRRNKNKAKKMLQMKVTTDLIQKGFPTDLAKAVVEKLNENVSHDDEEEILAQQIEKLLRKNQRYEPKKQKQKIITSLMQKGFSYDTIESYLSKNEITFKQE
ncbi:recombination regulator RecX [Listeria sp. PSOL-1]|uniref:recombination regulator RecX n=1 Tax=Listeria sp. PSOL-1 TaxID=1844999 RepID=UPI0013D71514|nr:recombination regulator RecX [Listeria sp. PSOL-1]